MTVDQMENYLDSKMEEILSFDGPLALTQTEENALADLPKETSDLIDELLSKYKADPLYDLRHLLVSKAIAHVLLNIPLFSDVIIQSYNNGTELAGYDGKGREEIST